MTSWQNKLETRPIFVNSEWNKSKNLLMISDHSNSYAGVTQTFQNTTEVKLNGTGIGGVDLSSTSYKTLDKTLLSGTTLTLSKTKLSGSYTKNTTDEIRIFIQFYNENETLIGTQSLLGFDDNSLTFVLTGDIKK